LCSVEIPSELFTGVHRIQLQEGVGIAYAKLKNLFEVNAPMEVPQQVCVTAFDLTQFREVPAPAAKRRSSSEPAKPDFKEIWDRKIS
jgi:hypothetical protein